MRKCVLRRLARETGDKSRRALDQGVRRVRGSASGAPDIKNLNR
jgi:hypothetical protein